MFPVNFLEEGESGEGEKEESGSLVQIGPSKDTHTHTHTHARACTCAPTPWALPISEIRKGITLKKRERETYRNLKPDLRIHIPKCRNFGKYKSKKEPPPIQKCYLLFPEKTTTNCVCVWIYIHTHIYVYIHIYIYNIIYNIISQPKTWCGRVTKAGPFLEGAGLLWWVSLAWRLLMGLINSCRNVSSFPPSLSFPWGHSVLPSPWTPSPFSLARVSPINLLHI